MDPISLEDLALLEVLHRVDQSMDMETGHGEILARLVESGLVTDDEAWPRLTAAGIELCKSLQHRVAADAQAAKILEQRAVDGGGEVAGNGVEASSQA